MREISIYFAKQMIHSFIAANSYWIKKQKVLKYR